MARPFPARSSSPDPRNRLGRASEALACAWLRLHGCRIVARRARIAGVEVDLVARQGRRALVVEVKSRRSGAGRLDACDLVTPLQRQRLDRAADRLGRDWDVPVRVDLVEVRWTPWPRVRWHRGAWEP